MNRLPSIRSHWRTAGRDNHNDFFKSHCSRIVTETSEQRVHRSRTYRERAVRSP